MKVRFLLAAIMIMMMQPALAQETYENTKLVDNDLNGTARYVGMGGAMEALGADISTISTNPAGIGLFRKSQATVSAGLVSLQDVKSFANKDKTNVSFDQIGFVYALQNGRGNYLNLAFNYHKSRDFNQILSAADRLSNASQNKLTYQKYRKEVFQRNNDATYSQVDYFYMNHLLYNETDDAYYNYPATEYAFRHAAKGYIGEYDLNISGNIKDRVYLGLTLGFHDVNYKGYTEYDERFESNPDGINYMESNDYREITGSGFDIKAGVIFRPVEHSPFRIGLSISTPTWYDLTTRNETSMSLNGRKPQMGESYDFKLYTPWKFGASIGHTIGHMLAFGVSYEYADYSCMDTRINEGGYYDYWYGSYYTESSSDINMNAHTKETLRGVSTFKIGMELKPTPELAVRLGYNAVTPMFKKDGYKDGTVWSPGTYYASQTAYVNWKDTHRLTCGVGYTFKNIFLDAAYQYTTTNGEFHPFMNYYENDVLPSTEDNIANAVDVSNKRHQLLVTVGYKF